MAARKIHETQMILRSCKNSHNVCSLALTLDKSGIHPWRAGGVTNPLLMLDTVFRRLRRRGNNATPSNLLCDRKAELVSPLSRSCAANPAPRHESHCHSFKMPPSCLAYLSRQFNKHFVVLKLVNKATRKISTFLKLVVKSNQKLIAWGHLTD